MNLLLFKLLISLFSLTIFIGCTEDNPNINRGRQLIIGYILLGLNLL